jgi:serine racemase
MSAAVSATIAADLPVTFADIEMAYDKIKPHVRETSIMTCESLDRISGKRLFFKCEFQQKTGSFKVRGATHASICAKEEGYESVCTHSSGNHAQALAYAAKSLSMSAHIVMPENAPSCKRDGVLEYGATVYTCPSTQSAREAKATQVSTETKSLFIHPFDNKNVIAGQGSIGIELLKQIPDLDMIVIPLGGGGMTSGIAIAAKAIKPSIIIVCAEPSGANDGFLSKSLNRCVTPSDPAYNAPSTIADGLRMTISKTTYPVIRDLVDDIVQVSETQIKEALLMIWMRTKCFIEPSAAVGLAAILTPEFKARWSKDEGQQYSKVGVILCGGNMDPAMLSSIYSP